MLDQTTAPAILIGAPCISEQWGSDSRLGYVAKIEAESLKVYTLGAGRMTPQTQKITVAWDNGTESTVHESTAAPWLKRAAHLPHCTEEKALEMLDRAKDKEAKRRAAELEARAAADVARAAFRDKYRDKIPADAKAILVAVEEIDDCDVQTDYFNTKRGRVVILGFSRHGKDLFSEMRKAASNFKETEHLADAPASAEHREKWSMGAGYYLKATDRYSTGWKVEKDRFYGDRADLAENLPFPAEWAVPEVEAAPEPKARPAKAAKPEAAPESEVESVNGATISEHLHEKKGFAFYIVQLPDRVARDTFDSLLRAAKAGGGWYSRAWQSTPGGFAFKDKAKATAFAGGL
jgi:hypothetical protein